MTATAHALVGGAIASTIHDPFIALPLAFASHPLLDMVPHWDFGWGWRKKTKLLLLTEALGDLFLGFALAYFLFGRGVNFWYFVACVFTSEVWDMAEAPYWFLGWKFSPFSWIYKCQSKIQGKANLPWGILTQIATVISFVFLLKTF